MELVSQLTPEYLNTIQYLDVVCSCPECNTTPALHRDSEDDDYVFCAACGHGKDVVPFGVDVKDAIQEWETFVLNQAAEAAESTEVNCPCCGKAFMQVAAELTAEKRRYVYSAECQECGYEDESLYPSTTQLVTEVTALRKQLEAQFGSEVMKGMVKWFKEKFGKGDKKEELSASDKSKLVAQAIAEAKANSGKVVLPPGHLVVPISAIRTPAEIERITKLKASLEGNKNDPVLGQYTKYLLCLLDS